ncbi:hypothetical protein Nepgr_031676 [Nepenthes gracilis]|uniref:Retrovirus-related Pol polyprotein from transposon TNT 1-94-like beta-barrel domain-containing protein n=1 Tax=Nepenthes gracilis TaxID=150966 RepID=A0AAD3Y5C0_NEPGR|nr:hypothetical protein Nepgr_031676 [Nepenthes gracilis]
MSKRGLFTSYTPGNFGVIRMGNEGTSQVVGKGDVVLTNNNGTKLILKDVRHVPNINLNIISASRLDDEDYYSTFYEGKWKLARGSLVVAREIRCSGLYIIKAFATVGDVNAATGMKTGDLWHRSFEKLWVYPLKSKDQVLGAFEQFHALMERQMRKKLKAVRSDNGGEYLGPFEECT